MDALNDVVNMYLHSLFRKFNTLRLTYSFYTLHQTIELTSVVFIIPHRKDNVNIYWGNPSIFLFKIH